MNGKYISVILVPMILMCANGQQNMDMLFEKFLQQSGRKNMKTLAANNINTQDPASLPVMYTLFKQIMQFTTKNKPTAPPDSPINTVTKPSQAITSKTNKAKPVFSAMQPPKALGTNAKQNFKFKPKPPPFSMSSGSSQQKPPITTSQTKAMNATQQNSNIFPMKPSNFQMPNRQAIQQNSNTFPTKPHNFPMPNRQATQQNSIIFPTKPPTFPIRNGQTTQQNLRTSVTKPPMFPIQNGQTTNTVNSWKNFNPGQQQQQQRPDTPIRPRTFREFSGQTSGNFNTGVQQRQSQFPNNFNQPPMNMNFGRGNFGNNANQESIPPPENAFQNQAFANFLNSFQTPETLWNNAGTRGGPQTTQNPMFNNQPRAVSNPASEQTFEQFILSMAQDIRQGQSNTPKNNLNAPKSNTFSSRSTMPVTTTPIPTISNPAAMPGNNPVMENLMSGLGPNMDVFQMLQAIGQSSSNNRQKPARGSSPPFSNSQRANNNILPTNVQATTPLPVTTTNSPPVNDPWANMINPTGNFVPPARGRVNSRRNFHSRMRNMLQMMIPLEYFVQDPVTGTFTAEKLEMLAPGFRRLRSEASTGNAANVEIFIDKGTSMGQGIFAIESTKCYIGVNSENRQFLGAIQNISQTVNPGQVILKTNHIPFTAMEVEPLTFTALRGISPRVANECEGKQSVYVKPAGMLPPSNGQKCFATAAANYCILPTLASENFRLPMLPGA